MNLWMRLRYPVKRKVVVNTKSDRTFSGVLWRKAWGYLVLRNVEMLKARGEAVAVDGEVVVLRENVDFVQVV